VKADSLVLCLLEPRQEPLLGHLQVLDVGGGTVQKRNLAGLLVGDLESALEATVVVLELISLSVPTRCVGEGFPRDDW
jgi:hypothetical protein